jgi:hypothetical protein
LACGKSRRGSATSVFALMMVAVAAISGAIIYHNLGASSSAIGLTPPSDAGQLSAVSTPEFANYTVAEGLHVAVVNTSFPADDFTASSTNSTFTCAASPSAAYIALKNNGTGTASVGSVSIAWAGAVAAFTPSGACDVGASVLGTVITYVTFPATSQVNQSAVSGQIYTGVVTLSDGVSIPFDGIWR